MKPQGPSPRPLPSRPHCHVLPPQSNVNVRLFTMMPCTTALVDDNSPSHKQSADGSPLRCILYLADELLGCRPLGEYSPRVRQETQSLVSLQASVGQEVPPLQGIPPQKSPSRRMAQCITAGWVAVWEELFPGKPKNIENTNLIAAIIQNLRSPQTPFCVPGNI